MSPLFSMRRFSRSNSVRNSQGPHSPPVSYTPPLTSANMVGNNNANLNTTASRPASRPASAATTSSYEFTNGPTSQQPQHLPASAVSNLSRTDQIVLRHFWESKYAENEKRDLHYLKFPYFGQYPSHSELLPYCEIYHLVKTSPGAKIISLGSAKGIYIGFELFSGSQLHIDINDDWNCNITHHRVTFKPYESMLHEPSSESAFRSWHKPLTIEFLEEQYQKWCLDLMSPCWEGKEVQELGPGGMGNGENGSNVTGNSA